MQKYQIMPDLTLEEYEDLKKDIQQRGVMVPIEYDEDGNILDGFNRKRICDELGITDYPTVIRAGMTEEEKLTHARKLNLARRHLSREQRESLIEDQLREAPEKSDRQVAEELGVDHKTVANVRAKTNPDQPEFSDQECVTGEIPQLHTTTGADGKARPANASEAEQQRSSIQDAIAEHPEKSDRQIAKELGANNKTVSTQRKKMVSAFNPSKRDEQALRDPDIVNRLEADEKLSVAGALKEQKHERLSEKPDTDNNKGIDVIITPTDDIPGVNGCRIVRSDVEEDPEWKADMHNMDCLEYMGTLPDESVDLIIADPPYFEVWGDFDFIWDSEDEYLEWIHECLSEFNRILKPTGTLMLWGTFGGNHLTLAKVMVWIDENGLFTKKNAITQRNTRGTGVQNNYMNCREDLIFYTKSDAYTFNTPYTDEISDRVDLGANGEPRKNDYKRASNVWADITEASQSSIERCFHPTTKPLRACDRIVQTHSNDGDLVYIPYVGSGSEIISCIKNGRQFLGTENNKDYFDQSIGRIDELLKRMS